MNTNSFVFETDLLEQILQAGGQGFKDHSYQIGRYLTRQYHKVPFSIIR